MILGAAPTFELKLQERRRYERIELALPGRCMLHDRHEYPCWTIDVSPAGVAIIGLQKGDIGERIIAYISQIGRIEGVIARRFDQGFAVEVQAPALKREKLAQRIAWLVKHETLGAPDERRHERIAPDRQQTTLRTPDGREYLAALIDVCVPGAALNVDAAPPIGSPVTIGRTSARVVRHFAGGIAVSFNDQLSVEVLKEDAKV